MRRLLVPVHVLVCFCSSCFAQSHTDVYKVTSPIQSLTNQLGAIKEKAEPAESGTLDPDTIASILDKLKADSKKPTIIHILRWKDDSHQTVAFQKWYFFDPSEPGWRFYKSGFYLESKQGFFQRTAIPGYTDFQFVFIHLNANLTAGVKEWASVPITTATATATLLANSVTSISLSNGGSGYSAAPTCTLTGGGGAGATCTAAVNGGVVTSVTVNSSGSGYSSPPTVAFGQSLTHPVAYTITVTKAQTQLIQDISTALQILGLPNVVSKLGEAPASNGYFGITTFQSQWTTSGTGRSVHRPRWTRIRS